MPKKLPLSFYNRDTLETARDILGKYIVYHSPNGKLSARIVEVEAYIGKGDPACHAAQGKTKRNEVMFGRAGFSYIYMIYGMYNCLNFVTEKDGFPAAILLRAAEPDEGVKIMKNNNLKKKQERILSGPGLFCKAFGLTREQNGLDLTKEKLYLESRNSNKIEIVQTGRIGISDGKELLWRFYDKNSSAVSRK